jgi:outer membrane lipoprotein SlyB
MNTNISQFSNTFERLLPIKSQTKYINMRFYKKRLTIGTKMKKLLLSALLLTGCASQGVDRDDQNQIIKDYYASVVSVTSVTLSSEVKTGIVAGAGFGVLEEIDGNTEDMIAGGIAGALVFGLFTALFEGDNEAFQYHLNSDTQGIFDVIQKKKIPESVLCVKVRSGREVELIAVNPEHCANPS